MNRREFIASLAAAAAAPSISFGKEHQINGWWWDNSPEGIEQFCRYFQSCPRGPILRFSNQTLKTDKTIIPPTNAERVWISETHIECVDECEAAFQLPDVDEGGHWAVTDCTIIRTQPYDPVRWL